jgi:RimJ/RimL family protein N-acetyltransferase
MLIKLRRVLHDIPAEQAVEWYHTVFSDEADTDIMNFHNEPLSMSVYHFEQRVRDLDELNEHVYYIISAVSGNVIGYASSYESRWLEQPHGREFGIFIKNKYRGVGFGTEVIKQLEQLYLAPYVLSPLITNTRAINLYERLGYTNTNIISDESGMLLMFKQDLES